jgi:hypothetical protein
MITAKQLVNEFEDALSNRFGFMWYTSGELWTQERQDAEAKSTKPNARANVNFGKRWIGRMVVDDTGLFEYAFREAGDKRTFSRQSLLSGCVARGTLTDGKRSDGQELKPGSIVFQIKEYTDEAKLKIAIYNLKIPVSYIERVGLYIGGGKVIYAANFTSGVSRASVDKFNAWGELRDVDYSVLPDGKAAKYTLHVEHISKADAENVVKFNKWSKMTREEI